MKSEGYDLTMIFASMMTPYGVHHHKRKALIPYMRTITTKPNPTQDKDKWP